MTAEIFDRIYATNGWNGRESRSGPGSGDAAAHRIATAIEILAGGLQATSTLDVGCGDGYWMPDLPGYVGIDPSERAIERARELHPERTYAVRDGAEIELGFDLVICRDAIQHLPLAHGRRILEAIRASGSTWLLASTYIGGDNQDVQAGDYYSPDLTAAPFDLPMPRALLFDGYGYDDDGAAIRDPRKFLGLWRLADV